MHTVRERGTSLIEVLVTVVIVAFGLMGAAGLQSRMQLSEVEAYQRTQALILLSDMANRITVNRSAAADYVTGALGAGMVCPTTMGTRAEIDLGQWCNALQGAAELTVGGDSAGAMLGGRGCVEALPENEFMVTVAWQGMTPVSPPAFSVNCGFGQYDGAAGSSCSNDRCRRVVTTVVRIATLD
jgi:type IV pilus assembly protein PilV